MDALRWGKVGVVNAKPQCDLGVFPATAYTRKTL